MAEPTDADRKLFFDALERIKAQRPDLSPQLSLLVAVHVVPAIVAAREEGDQTGFVRANAATAPGWRALCTALQMIRDAVEELGPVAACSVSRDQFVPRPIDDAEAIVAGILKTVDRAREEGRRKAIEEFSRRLGTRINDLLCETEPDYDDSITGINKAWDVVRALLEEMK